MTRQVVTGLDPAWPLRHLARMSSRRTPFGLFFVMASFALAGVGAAVTVSACSSSSDATGDGDDGGTDAPRDRSVGDTAVEPVDSATPETTDQCFARCAKEHPAAVAKYDAIDTCWAASCQGPCVDEDGTYDAGPDAAEGGTGNDGGTSLCGTEISSGIDRACDDCTEAACCPSWKACYDNDDCLDYNDCVGNCP